MKRTAAVLGIAGMTWALAGTAHAQWESRSVAGVDARIYTPDATSPIGDGRALMIVLHGCSQSADQLKDLGNFEPAADSLGYVIAIPNVPFGGVIAGCWDYYGPSHTRQSGHNAPLIAMTEALVADQTLSLDSAQLYITGFSSGGGQALIVGCLAPELFAGVAVSAGPSLGTTVAEIPQVSTTGDAAATLCQQFAGANAPDLASQLGVTLTDTNDLTVAQGYAQVNAEMFGAVFGPGLDAMSSTQLDVASLPGASPAGSGTVYADGMGPRIVWLQTMGVGHAYPAGSGEANGALAFVSGTGINFSMYVAEFFAANNLRADGEWTPGDDSGDDGGSDDGGSGDGGSDDDGQGGTDDGASDDGSEGGAASGGLPGQDDTERVDPTGCQCRQTPPKHAWVFAFLGVLWARRRRVV